MISHIIRAKSFYIQKYLTSKSSHHRLDHLTGIRSRRDFNSALGQGVLDRKDFRANNAHQPMSASKLFTPSLYPSHKKAHFYASFGKIKKKRDISC